VLVLRKIFSKKTEQKSHGRNLTLRELLSNDFSYDTTSQKSVKSYVKCCPVFIATKLISDACASIDIIIKDTKKDEFIYDHPLLKIIKKPNPFKSGRLFMKEMSAFYILTGNTYISVIRGSQPVIELDTIKPQLINIQENDNDGYAQTYEVNSTQAQIYTRDENKEFTRNNGNQLIHLKDFNPEDDSLVGLGTFVGCQLEISQYVLASIHNNALLENGARPSGMLTYKGKESLSDEQVLAVQDILKAQLTGAANAGSSTFLNGEFDWVQLSQSVKDMDFPTLKKSVERNIANAAKIPLPMIDPDNTALANMNSAKYAFYDNAVLPVLKQILGFLTQELLSKYKGSENLELAFDESAIEAIANRKIEAAKESGETGVLTKNEIRTIMGYEALTQGGDVIYQPMNLIPVGSDGYTADNREKPAEKAIFIKTMQEGGYSKEQINKAVEDHYESK
jgi:HK97 family phage portal protein